MIVGERIVEVSGKKEAPANIKGLAINISVNDTRVNGEEVEVDYEYLASYEEKVGTIKIKGTILAREDKKVAKDIAEEWKKSKKLPDIYAEMMLSAINYSGSANGTLVARVMNLTAPLIPPKIQLSKQTK